MIHSGQPAKDFIDSATRHVLLRQGVLGIKVKIMRGSDPEGKAGPQKTLPDSVTIIEPKEEQHVVQPVSQDYGAKAQAAQQAAEDARRADESQQQGVAMASRVTSRLRSRSIGWLGLFSSRIATALPSEDLRNLIAMALLLQRT